ncbi:MAG: hypothetical protein IKF90_01195, partial [Parasporobacterium sp.]|nr:hypothetical protein [Parasporobacterium sp.]
MQNAIANLCIFALQLSAFLFYIKQYMLCTNKLGRIKSISFTCPELNIIYPVSNAYRVPISKEILEHGTYSVESKRTEEYTTEEIPFTYQGEDIRISFSISKFLR